MYNVDKEDIKHIYDASLFEINDLDILLHETLNQTRSILDAQAGSIFIKENDELTLHVFQNDTLSYEEIYKEFNSFKEFTLPINKPESYLAVESLISQKIIVIDDVYKTNDYEFLGVKEFDKKFNYTTRSIITAPLIHPLTKEGLGVLQVINKVDNEDYVLFDEKDKYLLAMVSSFVALSVSKAKQDMEKLQDVNKNLEKRVKEEVQKNEKNSAIIYNQSKMASMGEMIGNIAHQWRQPLSTISMIAGCVESDMDMKEINKKRTASNASQIIKNTLHLSKTIDDFRNFYQVNKKNDAFNVSNSIKSCLNIVNAIVADNKITMILDLNEELEITSLKNEFTQCIINLITNAKDALVENNINHKKRFIFISIVKEENQIFIKVKDNAGGINNNIIDKIFNQHFTTKKENGSGIGLFVSKQIIEQHMNGEIYVENTNYSYQDEDYMGVEFTIKLPLS